MKPKPFSRLNHLTLPLGTLVSLIGKKATAIQ
jgi:hypothetical protein